MIIVIYSEYNDYSFHTQHSIKNYKKSTYKTNNCVSIKVQINL